MATEDTPKRKEVFNRRKHRLKMTRDSVKEIDYNYLEDEWREREWDPYYRPTGEYHGRFHMWRVGTGMYLPLSYRLAYPFFILFDKINKFRRLRKMKKKK